MTLELPNKLYFKIGEVAKFAEVATHVIRYWESEFDQIKPKRANSKQRLFRKEDVLLILKIKELLHNQGFTISGAKKFLAQGKMEPQPPAMRTVSETTPHKKVENKELQEIKKELLEIQEILRK